MSTWKKLVSQLTGGDKKAKKIEALVNVEEEENTIVTDEFRIIEMLMHVIDAKSEVLLTFGNKVLIYKAHFLPEKESGPGASEEPSSEYIRNKLYIVIGQTDPPGGRIKLANGQPATFSFVYGSKFNEFTGGIYQAVPDSMAQTGAGGVPQRPGIAAMPGMPGTGPRPGMPAMPLRPGMAPMVPLRTVKPMTPPPGTPEVTAAPDSEAATVYKITFPEKLFSKPQRRAAVRIKYYPEARVVLSISREAGTTFMATIADIGIGGVCFYLPAEEAQLSEGAEVDISFTWEEGEREVSVKGTLIKMGTRHSKPAGQIVFNIDSYEHVREIGEMVAHVERSRLQMRKHAVV
ncbi:PilZ domain-containing protein [Candidatus Magnetaquicoccus inordinatus]|uniref:PilZ domain-containing protein n=1 Tax=Candidatus Magnetaquicoccus inordinatus TaxID=2496818 RepID=UPI00102CFEA8|nr:PilZ domain-containing protein [Candidatus Magnetaquicoccus inordinatus]